MEIRKQEMIRDRLQFYKDRDESVHIVIEGNYFRNGKTIKFHDDNFEFKEDKLGVIIIYFSEVLRIEKQIIREVGG